MFAAYVGWDWADTEHELSIGVEGRVEKVVIAGSANAIHEWAASTLARFGGEQIAVCIEAARGTAIHALMCYPHIALFPVNPKSASSLREAFYPSEKKDDPVDADVLRDFVEKHRDRLRAFRPLDAVSRKLGLLSEQRSKVVSGITQTTNRLRSNLKNYFPQALELLGDLDTDLACAFLDEWPSLQRLQRARSSTVEKFLHKHNSRSAVRNEERLAVIGSAVPLTDDSALMEAGQLITQTLVLELRAKLRARATLEEAIASTYSGHQEHALFDSFPGVGTIVGARLASLLGIDRSRFESAEQLQRITGIAPVTKQSGGRQRSKKTVHRRYARSKYLHQTIVMWAGFSIPWSSWAAAFYQQQRAKGQSRYAALRSLGYKWLRILFHCWSTGTHYSEAAHVAELSRRGSPLASALSKV